MPGYFPSVGLSGTISVPQTAGDVPETLITAVAFARPTPGRRGVPRPRSYRPKSTVPDRGARDSACSATAAPREPGDEPLNLCHPRLTTSACHQPKRPGRGARARHREAVRAHRQHPTKPRTPWSDGAVHRDLPNGLAGPARSPDSRPPREGQRMGIRRGRARDIPQIGQQDPRCRASQAWARARLRTGCDGIPVRNPACPIFSSSSQPRNPCRLKAVAAPAPRSRVAHVSVHACLVVRG
jgi:hypothetical protein